jgi:fluoride exporter
MPTRDRREIAAILGGGALGALLRTGLSQAFPIESPGWPWVTLVVNIAGAFALGYFATRLQERLPLSAYRRPLLGTGFCGALTTFSTVQIELLELLDHHRYLTALGYTAVSVAAGYLAVVVATSVVRRSRVIA